MVRLTRGIGLLAMPDPVGELEAATGRGMGGLIASASSSEGLGATVTQQSRPKAFWLMLMCEVRELNARKPTSEVSALSKLVNLPH